jgi:hypothetical protein
MKKYNLIIVSIVAGALCLSSCKKFLDINKSPNSAEKVDPKLLFSGATISHAALRASGDFYIPIALGNQLIADGGNNPTAWDAPSPGEYSFSVNFFGNVWSAYTNTIINLKQTIAIAESSTPKNNNAAAQAKVFMAQTFYDLSCLFGDIPFSEAARSDVSYPKFDPQKQVFEGCIALLDEALAQFDDASPLKIGSAPDQAYDVFYKGDISKWKKAAKSMKLRILMTMVDKDATKAAAIGQLVTGGGLISSATDNMKMSFVNAAGRKNPKFALSEQYNGGDNFFFASKYVVDFMRPLNDPRLSKFFDKPAAADNYYGITPGDDGDDDHDARIAKSLHAADEPELFFSYQEELFFEAEVYARGLGVTVDLAKATTLYKKAIEESCKYYGVDATTAAAFAGGLPNPATAAELITLIHYQHWIDKMEEPGEAFTEWRRSGPDGSEVPALTLPIGAPSTPLFRRYEYHLSNELLLNPNAPAQLRYWEKVWFDL